MKKSIGIVWIATFLIASEMHCADTFKSISKMIGSPSFWANMGRTFGASPTGYVYNFQVISDAHVPIHVGQEGIASFMGAFFPSAKGLYGKKTLPPLSQATTGSSVKAIYDQSKYYFNMYISEKSDLIKTSIYQQSLTQVPLKQKDPNVYFYHVYTGKDYVKGKIVHTSKVEMLGVQDPTVQPPAVGSVQITKQLSTLAICNNLHQDAQVTLNYGTALYTTTLEKNSYNLLTVPTQKSSDGTTVPLFSLRPNTLSFTIYNSSSGKYQAFKQIALSSDGFDGFAYTLELFDDGKGPDICMQGLSAGNNDQPISLRVRDITPCPVTFWYQSVAQAKTSQEYVDLPGQVWIAYQGKDSVVMSKVMAGQVVSFNLVRPTLDQGDQYVMFIYVMTTDDVQAKKFVEKIAAKSLGVDIMEQYDTKMVKAQQKLVVSSIDQSTQQHKTLAGSLSYNDGIIHDAQQKIDGYILGCDVFAPKGIGSGNFYYVLAPSIINPSSIVSLLHHCVDSSKTSTEQETSIVTGWLQSYLQDSHATVTQVEQYLISHGSSNVVDESGKLTVFGKNQLQNLIQGPASLQNPAMKLSTVTNQYVYDFGKAAPENMPTTIISLPLQNVVASQDVVQQNSVDTKIAPVKSGVKTVTKK